MLQVSRYMKEATVCRDVVVRLILMKKDSGHRDYQHLDADVVRQRAEALTRRKDGTLPGGSEAWQATGRYIHVRNVPSRVCDKAPGAFIKRSRIHKEKRRRRMHRDSL